MKTPREILFGQHQAAERKLDAIRKKVVAGLAPDAPVQREPDAAGECRGGHPRSNPAGANCLWSLRWHLAGLSAAWLVVMTLTIDPTPAPTRGVARQDAPSQRQLLAALRENQRQLRELIGAPAAEPGPGTAETRAVAPESSPTVLHGTGLICFRP